ncbi:hypothetical protein DUNSADRAFT_10442 [Dunaliella salina]|uniref:Encoded protein n=1 Tax=Dunaliella salina TaxID=3046 RepID=A0ABQ7GFE6_DUNSA|nr:hypothetical protein DUNSADRAFT_10442 [Dunaliella salina]|eukprot:KAF5833321.1 hypothetical protein DUNSADRAFT_10442 [Dunaliella salina]
MQILLVGGTPPVEGSLESEDGLTPPMRRARVRHLRSKPGVDRETVKKWEQAIVDILLGGAPEGTTFHDIEEEWVVDTHTGRGSWKPVPKPSRAAMAAARERSDDGDDGVDDDDNF